MYAHTYDVTIDAKTYAGSPRTRAGSTRPRS
jgi:hypothetical protein